MQCMQANGHRVMVVSPRYDQYKDAWDTSVVSEVRPPRSDSDHTSQSHTPSYEPFSALMPADQDGRQVRDGQVLPLLQARSGPRVR
jgi:hypothetical protein